MAAVRQEEEGPKGVAVEGTLIVPQRQRGLVLRSVAVQFTTDVEF